MPLGLDNSWQVCYNTTESIRDVISEISRSMEQLEGYTYEIILPACVLWQLGHTAGRRRLI